MHYRETPHQPTNGAVLQTKQALLDHSPIRQTRQELEEIPNYFIFLIIFQVKSVHHYMLDKLIYLKKENTKFNISSDLF